MKYPPLILADLRNTALILQHYRQPLNACPKAVAAYGNKKVTVVMSGAVRSKAKMQSTFLSIQWTVTP